MLKKSILLLSAIGLLLFLQPGKVLAALPTATVSYSNQQTSTGTVDITVTYIDPGNVFTNVQYANAPNSSGSDLNWGTAMTITTSGSYKSVTIPGAAEYMDYYVRIANSGLTQTKIVKIYPVQTNAQRTSNNFVHVYTPTNCAMCHDTHTSLSAILIEKSSYYQVCMMCHSSANTQSKYDVEGGLVSVKGGVVPSLAGPFVNQLGTPVVSGHKPNDNSGAVPVTVPGSDPSKQLSLTCISCHNFHADETGNYRLLRTTIYADNGKTLSTSVTVNAYALTNSATSGESESLISGNVEFCTACHADFDQGNATTPGGKYQPSLSSPPGAPLGMTRYRHPVSVNGSGPSVYGDNGTLNPNLAPTSGDVLPLQYYPSQTGVTDQRTAVVCSSCHFAHGSIKSFNTQDTSADGKYMLRLDNYGVCESCHKK